MDDAQVLDAKPEADTQTAVVEYSRVEAGLADYRQRYRGVVYDLATTVGDKAARAARMEIRTARTTLERLRKEAKAPLIARCDLLDAEAKRITAELLKLEEPIDAQIKADEGRRERERAEREQRERERIASIRREIAAIAAIPVSLIGADSGAVELALTGLKLKLIDAEQFDEFVVEANGVRLQAASKVEQMLASVRAAEAEAARLAAERAELQRQREELEAAQRAEAERQAADQARIRAEQEAEAARLAAEREALKRQRAEAEAAERQRRAEAEQRAAELRAQEDAFRAEQEAARQQAQAEEQARLRRQQLAADAQADSVTTSAAPAPADSSPSFESIIDSTEDDAPAPVERPAELALALAVAEKFGASPNEAIEWLGTFSPTVAYEELKLLAKEIQ